MAMSSRNLLNLGMLLLVAVLAVVAIYEPGIEAEKSPPSLLAMAPDGIRHILIERSDQEPVELERVSDGSWQMIKPITIAANAFRMESLLRITEQKSLGSFPAREGELTSFQLDKPRVTLTLNGDTAITFGGNTPLDQRRYVRLGNTVHLISDTLYYHLIGSYTTFIDNRPLPAGSEPTAITLPGLSVTQAEGKWQVTPKPEGFSADQVTALIDHWKYASAIQVKPYDGTKGEVITVTLKGSEKPLPFLLTARTPELVLARPDLGLEYHLADSSADELLKLSPVKKEDGKDEAKAE